MHPRAPASHEHRAPARTILSLSHRGSTASDARRRPDYRNGRNSGAIHAPAYGTPRRARRKSAGSAARLIDLASCAMMRPMSDAGRRTAVRTAHDETSMDHHVCCDRRRRGRYRLRSVAIRAARLLDLGPARRPTSAPVVPRHPWHTRLGISCPTPDDISCDEVGLIVQLKRPADRLAVAINGQPVAMQRPLHRVCAPGAWANAPCGAFFQGYLRSAGLLHGRLAVQPDHGPHRWIGRTPVYAQVDMRAFYRDGSTAVATRRMRLSPGFVALPLPERSQLLRSGLPVLAVSTNARSCRPPGLLRHRDEEVVRRSVNALRGADSAGRTPAAREAAVPPPLVSCTEEAEGAGR